MLFCVCPLTRKGPKAHTPGIHSMDTPVVRLSAASPGIADARATVILATYAVSRCPKCHHISAIYGMTAVDEVGYPDRA